MTASTGHGLMCALQRESCCAVVEGAESLPLRGAVARLARLFRIVRVHMARGATLIGEVILAGRH